MTDCTPVDCGLHSEYELAIISQTRDSNDIQAIHSKSQLLKTNLRKSTQITHLI